jgi:tRNA 2-thiouridine synthesizing protein A
LTTEDDPQLLDLRGLKCPLPVLRAEKRLAQLPPGARLALLATDPMARVDIPLYCRQHGHDCLLAETGETLRFEIRKGGASPA